MMGILRFLFWVILFLGLTFSWYVLFEHGFSWEAYTRGSKEEYQNLLIKIKGS